jgi:hypothetical protein
MRTSDNPSSHCIIGLADERTRTADLISSGVRSRASTGLPAGCRYGGFDPSVGPLRCDQDPIFATGIGRLLEAFYLDQRSFEALLV